jgi:hypothetical protein
MGSTKKSTWVGGTVVLSALLLALAWFVFIAPVVDETATAAADTEAAETRNTQLTTQLGALKEQFANLPTYEAELAEIERQIPATHGQSGFIRLMDRLATESGTNIVDVAFDPAFDVIPAQPAETAPTATDASTEDAATAEGTAAPEEAAEPEAAPAEAAPVQPDVPAVIPGFVAVPVSITVLSNTPSAILFLTQLQEQSERLFLVTAIDGEGQDDAEPSGGRPAIAKGDVELVISGYLYVMQDLDGTTTEDEATEAPAPVAPPVGDGTGAFNNA